ncbi:MAG: M48 family metalloprotease [Cloacibacillus evryensis]
MKSEDEIAAVMCHEFIHADRAHGIVQAKRNNRLTLLTIAGSSPRLKREGTRARGSRRWRTAFRRR